MGTWETGVLELKKGSMLMLGRRNFVRLIGIGGATALAVACGPAAPPARLLRPPPRQRRNPPRLHDARSVRGPDHGRQARRGLGAGRREWQPARRSFSTRPRRPRRFKSRPSWPSWSRPASCRPSSKRLPEQPLVLKPTDEIGKYGGNWRMAFTGPADKQNMERHNHDHLIYWDAKVEKVVPHIARGWDIQDGGKTIVFKLRKGMKWSDGEPFTADDIMFWYEDLYLNDDLNPSKASFMADRRQAGHRREGRRLRRSPSSSTSPTTCSLDLIASLAVAGHMTEGWHAMGLWAPKHYMKQFHPKYTDTAKLDAAGQSRQASTTGRPTSRIGTTSRATSIARPPRPGTSPRPITGPQAVMERNPYYFAVDTDGNQLPYIDKITWTLAENLEVANLRAIAGEYDLQVRHMDIAKLPAFKENEAKGNYKVGFWKWPHGTDAGFFVNQDYDADPEIRQVADQQGVPPGAVDRHRPRPAQRGLLARPGRTRWTRRRPRTRCSAPDQARASCTRRSTPSRPTTCSTSSGSTKGPDGVRQRTDGKGALDPDSDDRWRGLRQLDRHRRDGLPALAQEHWHQGQRAKKSSGR